MVGREANDDPTQGQLVRLAVRCQHMEPMTQKYDTEKIICNELPNVQIEK